jgi:hypothetical protein
MRRNGGLFCLGDVVPDGYFTEAEIADLVSRGKITVTESKQVEIGSSESKAPELEAPKAPEHEEHEELEEHPDGLEHPDEPIDLGSWTGSKPKGKPKRRRV